MNLQLKRQCFPSLLFVVFFLLWMSGANQEVYAQAQDGVTLTAHVGFAGSCKENRWIPIRVTAENKGADLNGRIQVAYTNNKGGQSGYAIDLSLPGSSRKEFFLYLYPDGYLDKSNINLTVGERVVATIPLKVTCIGEKNLIVGLLTDTPTAFDSLHKLTESNDLTGIAPLQLTDLPDRAQGWEGLDALIISGADTGAITRQQHDALKIWLAQGGKLLIVGGPKWQSVRNGLDEFLPVDLNTTQTVSSLTAVSTYFQSSTPMEAQNAILAVGKLRPKASVLIAQDGTPVLVQKKMGFGTIYYLAADPGIQPLSNWADISRLYESLLKTPSARALWNNTNLETYSANQALAALPVLGLPPTIYVLCLLGLYILVVGPVNYLILRAIKRQEWAWGTIPVFVIIFTLVAYFSGYLIRGPRPMLNRLTVVQAWDDVDQAQAKALVGIYSPGRTKYTLQAGDAFLAYPFDSNNQTLQANQGWLSLQKDAEILLPDVLVESSGMKSVSLKGSLPAIALSHNLTLTLSGLSPVLSGTITNKSKYTFKDVTLMTSGDTKNLGDFPPGSVKQIQMSLQDDPMGTDIYDFQSQSIYTNYSDSQTDDAVVRKSSLIRAMMTNQNQFANKITSGIYLTGWLDEALLPTSVQGQGFDSIDTTFYMLNLTPTITSKPDEIKLSPSMFTSASSDPSMSAYMPQYSNESIPENGYVLSFKPTTSLTYSSIKSLTLTLHPGSGSITDVIVSLWDWQANAWKDIDGLNWGNNNIPDPARFVGPGGEIKMKVSRNFSANQMNPIQVSHFTLVVQP